MDKTVASAADAIADITDGSSVAVGGFGLSGILWILIEACPGLAAHGSWES